MSIFGTILSKIFSHDPHGSATTGSAPGAPAQATAANTGAPTSGSAPPPVASSPSSDTTGANNTASSDAAGSASAAAGRTVDVAQVLDAMPHREKLDWRHSIVDLLKLLDLDSGLSSRKELAHELGYSGDVSDTATMNIWLHKEVMRKLAANGGKVPSDLAH